MPNIAVGKPILANDFPASQHMNDGTAINDITSTAYLNGAPVVSVTFIAPTSGMVLLSVGGSFRDNTSTNRVHMSPIVRNTDSAGAIVLAADVTSRGVGSCGAISGFVYRSRTTLLTGLTPGNQYYANLAYKVSAGTTADIQRREITVVPLPLGGDHAGRKIKGADFPVAVWAQDTTQINNPVNRTYITGVPEVSVTFRGPTSGRVLIIVGGGLGNNTAPLGNRVFLSPKVQLTDSAGAVILVASVVNRGFGSDNSSVGFHYGSRESVLEGLIPGQLYYAVVQYTVVNDANGDTGDISARDITVVSIP